MPIGKNIIPLSDHPIRKTASIERKARNTRNTGKAHTAPIAFKKRPPVNRQKITLYPDTEKLQKLCNFAYWDRKSLADALNIVLGDGLKSKKTDPIPAEKGNKKGGA